MSGYQPFLIANPRVGMERDIEPWLLPEDGYPDLQDCYLWRGRVRKRQGFSFLGRLNKKIGTTDALGNFTFNFPATLVNFPLPMSPAVSSFVVGASHFQDSGTNSSITNITQAINADITVGSTLGFSIGNTVLVTGVVGLVGINGLSGTITMIVGNVITTTINSSAFVPPYVSGGTLINLSLLVNGVGQAILNTITGVVTITGAPALTDVFYFPGLPVTALSTYETVDSNGTSVINIESLVGFDTRFAYLFDGGAKKFVDFSLYHGTLNEFNWTGSDADLFWTTNYADAFWATNNKPGFQNMETVTQALRGDGLRWADSDGSGWINFLPNTTGTDFLMGALMLIPYKGVLIALSTWEGTDLTANNFNNFQQRARWNGPLLGTPYYATVPNEYQGGPNPTAWRSDIPGNGGFIDAPTSEVIVSCELLKDTLIVYFERSTWQLVFTGVSTQPFIWQKINTELGSESTFSVVPFDRTVIAVGDVGIHACDTVNVERIDQKIPSEVFAIQNANRGPERTYGIRDYYNQLVYWSFPYIGADEPASGTLIYPNRLLVYNYIDQSFSYFNDSFTCFGYYQSSENLLWSSAEQKWQESSFLWVSPITQAEFPNIVGGNQHGFVEILMQDTVNDQSLFISNMVFGVNTITLTIPNHNLVETTSTTPAPPYIKFITASGTTGLVDGIFKILQVPDQNTVIINRGAATGPFTGSGTIAPVNNINILTKRFNPWVQEGAQARLGYADFYFKRTTNGQVSVNLFIDEDTTLPIQSKIIATKSETTYQKSPDSVPYEQDKLWKRAYFEDIEQLFQLQITMNELQMTDPNISSSEIILHGVILWSSKSGRLINV